MSFLWLSKTKIWWKSTIVLYGYRIDGFIVYIKTDDIYKYITEDGETRFDTLSCELDRLLPKEKSKKVVGLMKDNLCGEIMMKFVGLRAKTYSCLTDDGR